MLRNVGFNVLDRDATKQVDQPATGSPVPEQGRQCKNGCTCYGIDERIGPVFEIRESDHDQRLRILKHTHNSMRSVPIKVGVPRQVGVLIAQAAATLRMARQNLPTGSARPPTMRHTQPQPTV
jgi:hypothetical protein